MKRILFSIVCIMMIASFYSTKAYAVGSGDIIVEYPQLSVGYLDKDWQFQTYTGTSALFTLSLDNLQTADKNVGVLGAALTGTSTVTKTDVSGKRIAVQNHVGTYKMRPGNSTSAFPSIWIKGDFANPDASPSKPSNFLTGTDADKFYQTGLVIQAPYWEPATYQWAIYMYADKDWLTQTAGPTTGKVLDPRVSSIRWFSWADNANGIPQKMWKEKDNSGIVSAFNTLPLIASNATEAQKKAFLASTSGTALPETAAGLSAIAGSANDPTDNNSTIYNTNRNTAAANNANGMQIVDRSQTGLVYVSPSDAFSSHRTEYVRVQFIVKWPRGVGITAGSKNCNIDIYQKTSD